MHAHDCCCFSARADKIVVLENWLNRTYWSKAVVILSKVGVEDPVNGHQQARDVGEDTQLTAPPTQQWWLEEEGWSPRSENFIE